MSKKTIILTQEQINEICGDNFAFDYLNYSDTDLSGNDYGNEASLGKGVDGDYPDILDTDQYAHELPPGLPLYLNPAGGRLPVGNINYGGIREMKKSDFEKMAFNEGKAHGNKRFEYRKFGDPSTNQNFDQSELTQQEYRDREALKNLRSNDPNTKLKGLNYFKKTSKNRQKDGKIAAIKQFDAAKNVDSQIHHEIESKPKITGNNGAHTKKTPNGVITM